MSSELITLGTRSATELLSLVEAQGDTTKAGICGGVKVLDPKRRKIIGYAQANTGASIGISGQWCPGRGHPYWPSTGDPITKYRGANKWSAIVVVQAARGDLQPGPVIQAFQYPGSPAPVTTASPYGVWISVVMNDDDYNDNTQHPTDPMTAECGGCV